MSKIFRILYFPSSALSNYRRSQLLHTLPLSLSAKEGQSAQALHARALRSIAVDPDPIQSVFPRTNNTIQA